MKFTVAGLGYVGLANAVMLSERYEVSAFDIDEAKVIKTKEKFRIDATTDGKKACRNADFVIIATPTDYVSERGGFDTSSIENVVALVLEASPNACVVIKSTLPVGYTDKLMKKTGLKRCLFSPEFLREGREIEDCLNPSRVVIGRGPGMEKWAEEYGNALMNCIRKDDTSVLYCTPTEAESIKLFSNAYLAVRVAFFNELDSFAEERRLDSKTLIKGVCLDERIGDFYNNPSFGFGGYCLPKDTRQLASDFGSIPQSLFSAVVDSNDKRMSFVADRICSKKPKTVGVYRLSMKSGSDNYRSSAVLGVMDELEKRGVKTVVYEPMLKCRSFGNSEVIRDLGEFKARADVIIANRYSGELRDVREKVYTRDVFCKD